LVLKSVSFKGEIQGYFKVRLRVRFHGLYQAQDKKMIILLLFLLILIEFISVVLKKCCNSKKGLNSLRSGTPSKSSLKKFGFRKNVPIISY